MLVQHLLQQIQLTCSHHHDRHQLYYCEVLDLVLVPRDYLGVDYLPLFLKELILGDLLQPLSNIDQFGVQLVDFAFLGQFKQVSLVVGIEVNRYGFVAPVGGNEADVEAAIPTHFRLVIVPQQTNR